MTKSGHSACASAEEDVSNRAAGWIGEQNLAYFLECFLNTSFCIFYGLQLDNCQIDVLILAPTFISIIEVKSYSGFITFTNENGQIIRSLGKRRDGFSKPLLQVDRQPPRIASTMVCLDRAAADTDRS
ncbi:NERD domain-containing protein [Sporolactobacillus shoreicorticis]|uniref:Nuclease-related domain-containing protein n=1 Tax=Sporolactobacillus shoreicorticis TaxID=1923877 RepID=A0ABW5S451_9BACL|nr:nuclease-related domain-containing protein [Sporolactobacillus shoreicorticis]MCO7127116.1 NERD domain-containing protein [Sporolactobacillus shoreicorticis]